MRGLSLVELIIILFILSTLAVFGASNFTSFWIRQECQCALDNVQSAISFARHTALLRGKTITLCASHDNLHCHGGNDWSKGFIIFENTTREKQPKERKYILKIIESLRYGSLIFSYPGNLLHIEPTGTTMCLGSFTYIPPHNLSLKSPQILVINHVGRCYQK